MPKIDKKDSNIDKVRKYSECLALGNNERRSLWRLAEITVPHHVYEEYCTKKYVEKYLSDQKLKKYATRAIKRIEHAKKKEMYLERQRIESTDVFLYPLTDNDNDINQEDANNLFAQVLNQHKTDRTKTVSVDSDGEDTKEAKKDEAEGESEQTLTSPNDMNQNKTKEESQCNTPDTITSNDSKTDDSS